MGAMPMYVPDFKTIVMPAIVAAMDEWKADAERSESPWGDGPWGQGRGLSVCKAVRKSSLCGAV